MRIRSFVALASLTVSMLGAGANGALAGVITLADTEFLDANWEIGAQESPLSGYVYSSSGSQAATGGNPGKYRATYQFLQGPGILIPTHDFKTALDPANGAILSLDYALDIINTRTDGGGEAITFLPALLQIGPNNEHWAFYAFGHANGVASSPSSLGWQSMVENGLTCAEFDRADRSSNPNLYPPTLLGTHPDCSASGGLIYFGFATYNYNNAQNYQPQYFGGVDNWSVRITTDAVTNDVPEPGTLTLLGAALLGLCVRRIRS